MCWCEGAKLGTCWSWIRKTEMAVMCTSLHDVVIVGRCTGMGIRSMCCPLLSPAVQRPTWQEKWPETEPEMEPDERDHLTCKRK